MDLTLPKSLIEGVAHNGRPEQVAWLDQLPQILSELADRWSLRVGDPFQPGGSCSWVAPAQDANGRNLVLKVGWRHDEALHEAEGLRSWGGRGAVVVHDSHAAGPTSSLLLERCRPGTTLGSALPGPEQDVVVGRLLARLWITPPAGHGFRPLQEMCDSWASAAEGRREASAEGFDPGLVRAGLELFRSLPAGAEREVLLCTDLHAGNVLAAEREPWLAIDPKPYVGDPTYDALQHLLNRRQGLMGDPDGLVGRMADLLDIDRVRLRLWLFARCVVEGVDDQALRPVAEALAPG